MKLTPFILATLLAGALPARAQMVVNDPAVLAQSIRQVTAWQQQLSQMQNQVNAVSGDRGMGRVLGAASPALPPDWASATTQLSAMANGIRQAQAVLTPAQSAQLAPQLRTLLSQAQSLSAATQAMAQTAYKSAASDSQARLDTLHGQMATKDLKASADLANATALEQARLINQQNQLLAAANAAAAQAEADRLRINQMRVATGGTGTLPQIDFSIP